MLASAALTCLWCHCSSPAKFSFGGPGFSDRCGGKRKGDKGYYVEPTVFTDVKDHMKISREEIFGPVQCISKWSSMEEVSG
jgi:hypothetical protein